MANDTTNSTATASAGTLPRNAAQEVFLTPRVVDAATFASFSATLRELLADADERRQSLNMLNGEVATLRDALRALTTELEAKLMTAVKVIPAIDQRLSKVNDALTFAEAVVRSQTTERVTAQTRETAADAAPPPASLTNAHTGDAAEIAATTASIARHAEERLAQVIADARGELDATTQVHLDSVREMREDAEARLHHHTLGLETDLRARLEGVLLEGLSRSVTELAAQMSQRLEAALEERLEGLIRQRVDAAVSAAVAQQLNTMMPERVGTLVREHADVVQSAQTAKDLARLQQQIDDLTRWTQRIDAVLNDHSGLVAAQSAHSALAQIATQAAGLGQHLETLTRRAEMTAHTLAGLMSQLPMTAQVTMQQPIQRASPPGAAFVPGAMLMPQIPAVPGIPAPRDQHR